MSHQPRDFEASHRTGWVRAARLYSNIVSPPVMFALMGFLLAWYENPNFEGIKWGFIYGLGVSLAPILIVAYLLYTGYISELHMSNTRERHIPYSSAVVFATLTAIMTRMVGGPELIYCLAIFNAITLAALGLINIYWLISIHATAAAAMALLMGLVYGPLYGLLLVPVVISVIVVRLYLRRHTLAQVAAGTGLAVVTVTIMVLLGCF
ncbi:MAG TPA: hypothetical protein VLL52_00935 [Anaerolineae bacterium]|nr:hypothetical protein [Anaerolineae bacterium]